MLDILGWRIAFWLSAVFGGIGVWLRRSLEDSKDFTDNKAAHGETISPLRTVMTKHWREVLLTVGNTALWTTLFWLSFVWLAAYSEGLTETKAAGDPDDERDPFLVSLGAQLFCCLLFPFVGLIADQTGTEMVTTVGMVLTAIAIIPIFILLSDGSAFLYTVGQLMLAVLLTLIGAPLPVWMVRQFPVEYRYTGMGISYNLAQAIFGGPAAAIATALSRVEVIGGYGSQPGLTPAIYIMGVALFALGVKAYGWGYQAKRKYERLLAGGAMGPSTDAAEPLVATSNGRDGDGGGYGTRDIEG